MSCSDTNPCSDPCQETNPCYDNCGCINPTTFECVTKPGVYSYISVTNNMNGQQVISAINDAIGELSAAIGAITDPVDNTNDIYSKVSDNDSTTGYLDTKLEVGPYLAKTILSPGGNEKLRFNVIPGNLISANSGNLLSLGSDGKFNVQIPEPDGTETKIVEGSGVTVTGTGSASDAYVISINPSITAARSCFTGVWQDITLVTVSNSNVTYVSGAPKYRIRYDGTIEFKGNATYTVDFGAYSTGNRKQLATIGNLATSCITLTEHAGVSDLKGINYIDVPQVSADQIVQQYGYIIRKSVQNIIIEFQSSFTASTTKTIVVSFDGVVSHPNI